MTPIKDWPRVPIHRIDSNGIYMVTAATLHKQHFFTTDEKLTLLENELLSLAKQYQWQLEAWAVFVNHYHFVARRGSDTGSLNRFLKHLHANTARQVNKLDQQTGREVWYNYWDKKLMFETSYLARLNYVHHNAVKHGLVMVANQYQWCSAAWFEYQWCSAAWFERVASPATVKTIYSFKTEKLKVYDDF